MKALQIVVFAILGGGFSLFGDTIKPSAGSSFVNSPGASESGQPTSAFWDNPSVDGPQRNVGYVLTGTGGWAGSPLSPQLPSLQFWSAGGNSANTDETFLRSVGAPFAISLIEDTTALNDVFGWYDVLDPTTLHPLFATGISPVGSSFLFTPSAEYGFFLTSSQSTGFTYYSQSGMNSSLYGEQTHQHFSVFQNTKPGSSGLIIGAEDAVGRNGFYAGGEGYGDFNDVIVSVQQTPEPGTFWMLAIGVVLSGVGVYKKRKQQAR